MNVSKDRNLFELLLITFSNLELLLIINKYDLFIFYKCTNI